MKVKSNGWLKKGSSLLIIGLILLLSVTGCNKSSSAKPFKMDNLATASAVTLTNGQRDWRNYTQKKTFASGYSGEFWVTFSFSNALHDKTVNVKGNIYMVLNGVLIDQKSKDVNLTDSTDNSLFWGDSFDISKYADGDYTVIVTMTDLISATSTSIMNTFKIGGSS
jgi:hypothetical protein